MSNRLRLHPTVDATVRRALRCPDCLSEVTVDRHGAVQVAHDNGCPMLAERTRTGRLIQLVVLPRQSSHNERETT